MSQTELKNPLAIDTNSISKDIEIDQFLLFSLSLQLEQSAHLVSLIDMTQATHVTLEQVQKWQKLLSSINTSKLSTVQNTLQKTEKQSNQNQLILTQIDQTKSVIQEYSQTQRTTTQYNSNINQSQLSKSINLNLGQHSFKLFVKKQNDKQKYIEKLKTQEQMRPKQHKCQIIDNKLKLYPQPQRYRSISSQYSPLRMSEYLNEQAQELRVNKRWLNPIKKSHSPQLIISSQISQEQIVKDFQLKNITWSSIAQKHLTLSSITK